MRFERVAAVIGVCAMAAIVGIGAYHIQASLSGPPPEPMPSPISAPDQTAKKPRLPENVKPILERNIFAPPTTSQVSREEQGEPGPAVQSGVAPFVPPLEYVPPALPAPAVDAGELTEVADTREPKAEQEEGRAQIEPKPPAASIAITATVMGPDGLRALVEDKNSGGSHWVSEGEAAFGYTLRQVTSKGGLFEKDSRWYALALGAGKKLAPVPSAKVPVAKTEEITKEG